LFPAPGEGGRDLAVFLNISTLAMSYFRKALMSFKPGGFLPGKTVQPVLIRYKVSVFFRIFFVTQKTNGRNCSVNGLGKEIQIYNLSRIGDSQFQNSYIFLRRENLRNGNGFG
jgi:hypothetical protein